LPDRNPADPLKSRPDSYFRGRWRDRGRLVGSGLVAGYFPAKGEYNNIADFLTQGDDSLARDNTVFELKHVSFRYRPHEPALLDVNLTVAEGDKIVILGPNGAGKTTLEKILAGILPAEGRLRAFGKPLTVQEIQSKTENAAYRRRWGQCSSRSSFAWSAPRCSTKSCWPAAAGLAARGGRPAHGAASLISAIFAGW
jgi:ABC-type glutathione transport system ATPase component